ncbi:putative effector protein [Ceratobasidium theobromae]|uniref:Putative effector protein n=1 Tax=Ceratobasidium theobromae TaxID=1582974 RepID=A0A5N5QDJ5_9AGAM|nr:putative effector protein [Ceratobasidium theobromae]
MLRNSLLSLALITLCFHGVHSASPPPPDYIEGTEWGGPNGHSFNDYYDIKTFTNPRLTSVTLRGDKRMDGIEYTVTYGNNQKKTYKHGGGGGTAGTALELAAGEVITQYDICAHKKDYHTRIFYLKLYTNKNQERHTGHDMGSGSCNYGEKPPGGGYDPVGFFGREGEEIDALGFIYKHHK